MKFFVEILCYTFIISILLFRASSSFASSGYSLACPKVWRSLLID